MHKARARSCSIANQHRASRALTIHDRTAPRAEALAARIRAGWRGPAVTRGAPTRRVTTSSSGPQSFRSLNCPGTLCRAGAL